MYNFEKTDDNIKKLAKKKWDSIAKPIDSLGEFENLFIKISAIKENIDFSIKNKTMVVFCSDNGVVAEGVTQTDSSVTTIVANNISFIAGIFINKFSNSPKESIGFAIESHFFFASFFILSSVFSKLYIVSPKQKGCDVTHSPNAILLNKFNPYHFIWFSKSTLTDTSVGYTVEFTFFLKYSFYISLC